jgi:hypothetical protein
MAEKQQVDKGYALNYAVCGLDDSTKRGPDGNIIPPIARVQRSNTTVKPFRKFPLAPWCIAWPWVLVVRKGKGILGLLAHLWF